MLNLRHIGGMRHLVESLRDVLAFGTEERGCHKQREDDGGDEKVRRAAVGQPDGAKAGALVMDDENACPGVKY